MLTFTVFGQREEEKEVFYLPFTVLYLSENIDEFSYSQS
jgi:hypothetical protein